MNPDNTHAKLAGGNGAGDAGEGGEAGGAAPREARAVRVADALRARLDQLRGENAQLEELLRQADARVSGAPPASASHRVRKSPLFGMPAWPILFNTARTPAVAQYCRCVVNLCL